MTSRPHPLKNDEPQSGCHSLTRWILDPNDPNQTIEGYPSPFEWSSTAQRPMTNPFASLNFHPVIHLPDEYDVYDDFTEGYDPNRSERRFRLDGMTKIERACTQVHVY